MEQKKKEALEREVQNLKAEIEKYKENAYYKYTESQAYIYEQAEIDKLNRRNKKLEDDIKKLKSNNQKLINENQRLKDENRQLLDKNTSKWEEETKLINHLKDENDQLKSQVGKPVIKHNERGAGRKDRFTLREKETIKMYRMQGKKLNEIADMFGCSIGLIHKIINEK